MMRRTPMKRTAWPAREPLREQAPKVNGTSAGKALTAIKPIAVKANYATVSRDVGAAPIPKAAPVRSEAYRRAVASLPCINCGVPGYSQCAHSNSGKGAGIKASDLDSFPLCTVHPGADGSLVQGCHERFDQGALFLKSVRRELEPAWAADTRRKIQAMGLWPKGLPAPDD